MENRYELTEKEKGYTFTTDFGLKYSVEFFYNALLDSEGNSHVAWSLNFERDDEFNNELFSHRFDEKIKNTILYIVSRFFKKNDHSSIIYFCFNNDGLGRHRSIVFGQWIREYRYIEYKRKLIKTKEECIYSGIMVLADNPLKQLIFEAYDKCIDDLSNDKEYELTIDC